MDKEKYSEKFHALLRQRAADALQIRDSAALEQRLVELYGRSPRMTASIAGQMSGFSPEIALGVFTASKLVIHNQQSGGFFSSLSAAKRAVRADLEKISAKFPIDTKIITQPVLAQFGKNYNTARLLLLKQLEADKAGD